MANEASVSVIIPVYNSGATINRAIKSVVQQDYLLEIIIVDDGSTDNSRQVVTSLLSDFQLIRFIELPLNIGASGARNAGINCARGKYIAFLDADDVWLPGKLAKQVKIMILDSDVSIVSCDSLQLSPVGDFLKRAHKNRVPVDGGDAWKTLLAYNFLPTPTIVAKRSDILAVGGFSEDLKVGEDLDLWIRLALQGCVVVLSEVFVHYYDYPGSLMKTDGEAGEGKVENMIKQYIIQNSNKLNSTEIRTILGTRQHDLGLNHFFSGDYIGSLSYFYHSIMMRFQIFKSLLFIIRAIFLRK